MSWCEFWYFSVSLRPKHTHTQNCALLVSLNGEGRQIVATTIRMFVEICLGCVCGRCHVWQQTVEVRVRRAGVLLRTLHRRLLFITDSTHRLHRPARICILKSCFGHLVKQAVVLSKFSAALTSVALETCLTSNVGLCNLLISGWVGLAEKLLCRQRDCRYFRLWFCSAVNPI